MFEADRPTPRNCHNLPRDPPLQLLPNPRPDLQVAIIRMQDAAVSHDRVTRFPQLQAIADFYAQAKVTQDQLISGYGP
ncbi:hypothetical protein PROH_12165 [Prochlorothrix hollandica PCC 9006 = CALU 1027]|uniref:Uncharacterized protein n=1 Tax=Prochlorothrix hollandica PCC 9006 = CALU 1027 TaxID=317619 RepID=A0A0M2PZB0_PROHO|nr:hypothetical protein PROH_12165 [Prochlorothrix hollandica PCC 9006 = CALU 1027]